MESNENNKKEKNFTRTSGEMKDYLLKKAKIETHTELDTRTERGIKLKKLWFNYLNHEDFKRGYNHEEYIKPGTPCLQDMKLFTEKEFEEFKEKVDEIVS